MRIGELASLTGVATSAIRFYEESGLLPAPPRTPSGYRDYDPVAADRVAFIQAGQAVGLTLGELREVLAIRDAGEPPCRHVRDLLDRRLAEVDERIDELRRLRRDLRAVADSAAELDPTECAPESICQILAG